MAAMAAAGDGDVDDDAHDEVACAHRRGNANKHWLMPPFGEDAHTHTHNTQCTATASD